MVVIVFVGFEVWFFIACFEEPSSGDLWHTTEVVSLGFCLEFTESPSDKLMLIFSCLMWKKAPTAHTWERECNKHVTIVSWYFSCMSKYYEDHPYVVLLLLPDKAAQNAVYSK